jgi:hypothetical protein
MLGPATVAIDSRVLLSFWPFGDVEGHWCHEVHIEQFIDEMG